MTDTPIDWWRQLSGGALAQGRPPPPGVGDPYPNLAEVPARPQPTDAQTRRTISAGLTSERDQTRRAMANDPLPVAAPRPSTAAAPPQPAPDPNASSVVVEAANAPPPPPNPPAGRGTKGQGASASRSAAAPAGAFPDMPAPISAATPAAAAGEMPVLPTSPPPLPNVEPVAQPAIPQIRPGVPVAFAPSSADLSQDGIRALVALASQRRGGRVSVVGFGDAPAGSTSGQARTLVLALRRAQSMADALLAAGVPGGAIVLDAQAAGRGGTARLID